MSRNASQPREEPSHPDGGAEVLRIELHDIGHDPLGQDRPLEIRQRQALKQLLRRFGLRAKWWAPKYGSEETESRGAVLVHLRAGDIREDRS